jgi:uncharacterized protein (DUF779 family)
LSSFEYSVDGGSNFNAPTNGDNSTALSTNWDDNGSSWSTASSLGSATAHSFTFNTNHADVSGMSGISQSDIQIRFTANDGSTNSTSPGTSEDFEVDNESPAFTSVTPVNSASISNANVGYTLNETIASGTVTYTRTGGSADGSSPHVVNLAGAELNSGSFSGALTNAPTLVDDAVYSIAFNGVDAAGNVATTVTSTSVTFDGTAPVFSGVSPSTSSSVNTADVNYTLSEALASGTVTFTQTGGSADGSSPHLVNLTGTELNTGAFSGALTNAPTLVDGAIYSIA